MLILKNFLSRRHWVGLVSLLGIAALTGCSATGALNALVPSDSHAFRPDIAHGQDPRQQLDVYLPLARQQAGPVVVFFYGGSRTTGSRPSVCWWAWPSATASAT